MLLHDPFRAWCAPKLSPIGTFKVPEGHHPRGTSCRTTLREVLRGNLSLRGGEFRAWLVRAIFQANSEQIPSELRVPSKLRANSEQIPGKFRASTPNPLFPCHSVQRMSLVGRHTNLWGETHHARNLALRGFSLNFAGASAGVSSRVLRGSAGLCRALQGSAGFSEGSDPIFVTLDNCPKDPAIQTTLRIVNHYGDRKPLRA